MQLIQIGQSPAKTLQQLIEEMAAVQTAEIEQLKQAALARHAAAQLRRKAGTRSGVRRAACKRPAPYRARLALKV